MKKFLFMIVVLSCFSLVACGNAEPTDTVEQFMTAIQNDDWEKAYTYIDTQTEPTDLTDLANGDEAYMKQMLSAISKSFEFESITEASSDEENATVTVDITSLDFSIAVTSTMSEIMPLAFGLAFSEDEAAAEKQIEDLTAATLMKHLTNENASLATRNITLDLKKDAEGDFLIVANDSLTDAILANASQIDSMFGE